MNGLIILILGILPVAAFAVGVTMARQRPTTGQPLTRVERKELILRRNFEADLTIKASEQATLGDAFAIIVLDMLADQRRALR